MRAERSWRNFGTKWGKVGFKCLGRKGIFNRFSAVYVLAEIHLQEEGISHLTPRQQSWEGSNNA